MAETDMAETRTTRTALRICPLCEATCGLTLTIDDTLGRVTGARGDREDVFTIKTPLLWPMTIS